LFCSQNDPTKLGETYDGFLAAFPLCYGYWQKFADAEARFRGAEAAQAVYERGVAAIPNSIDLWLHYCQFKQSIHPPPDDVRRCGLTARFGSFPSASHLRLGPRSPASDASQCCVSLCEMPCKAALQNGNKV